MLCRNVRAESVLRTDARPHWLVLERPPRALRTLLRGPLDPHSSILQHSQGERVDATEQIFVGYEVPPALIRLIDNANEFVVLTTAYLETWSHLENAIRKAVARDVDVRCILRSPDRSNRSRLRAEAVEELKALGVSIHEVDRLHAKAYVNEQEVLVTSLNLLRASQDSIEIAARFTSRDHVKRTLSLLAEYCPGVADLVAPKPRAAGRDRRRSDGGRSHAGFCIGCGEDVEQFDLEKPMCRECYRRSSKGTESAVLDRKSCHMCRRKAETSLRRPLCNPCYASVEV